MSTPIAIVGMACVYPDARSPKELWDNVLAQRRAFRSIPSERLCHQDYYSADHLAPDMTYATEAALIEGYEFDRVAFRVVGSTYRAADLAHWLALDVAAQALADAGFPDGDHLPRQTTGVLLGNTLTGEVSRANTLRLRWPYVRRVVDAGLKQHGWSQDQRAAFFETLEVQYKAPFPPVGEETLAGGLSNTIAGRICNQWDLKGGGYTVDGACASSLLAVASACSALAEGDLDVALAGGVDLSLDPFELVGFSKTGALAPEEMRIYDARSAGFWPGEGCGWVVLMRLADVLAQHRRRYAVIRGWGISSDGHGGITRPEMDGQVQALRRAYRRAGCAIDTVTYCEGHGTGTKVGDSIELKVLSHARREVNPQAPPAAIGSIKANIGHTKAAAGVAGLIKAALAIHHQIIPPTTGCAQPHPELEGTAPALRILKEPELWPAHRPLRASVSAMGFGGINAHLVLEGIATERRTAFTPEEQALTNSVQDAELFLFEGASIPSLIQQAAQLGHFARRISRAELTDLSVGLEKRLEHGTFRGAVVAGTPTELAERLELLQLRLASGATSHLDTVNGVFLGELKSSPRIGFLFPGQGSPGYLDGGLYGRRFPFIRELYQRSSWPVDRGSISTDVAQPAIVTASLAGLAVLNRLGITADIAVGHSLGELTAYHWAGACDEDTVLGLARIRGKAMAELGSPTGAMAAIEAAGESVHRLINGEPVIIAGYNSPRQTVISGESSAIGAVMSRAQERGFHAVKLPVSHAFHTPLVSGATALLAGHLNRTALARLQRKVFSTVTGNLLKPDEDLRSLLCRQVTSPVRFMESLGAALGLDSPGHAPHAGLPNVRSNPVDLWIEVGPGQVLSDLLHDFAALPVVALDSGGSSMRGLLHAAGAAFSLGVSLEWATLFASRFSRPFNLDWHPKFFTNPCELAPKSEEFPNTAKVGPVAAEPLKSAVHTPSEGESFKPEQLELARRPAMPRDHTTLEIIRQEVARRAELPSAAVKDDDRLLSDLHLNSIAVSQLVADAARKLGLPPLQALTDFANATVAEVATALETLGQQPRAKSDDDQRHHPSGLDAWIRPFVMEWVKQPLPPLLSQENAGTWKVFAPAGHTLAVTLRESLARTGGVGVLVCLPELPNENHVNLLLAGARAALANREESRFCLVHHGWGAGGLARALHLEAPGIRTCVVNVPPDHPQAAAWVRNEALAVPSYTEARYDVNGERWVPQLKLFSPINDSRVPPLNGNDVLLVTGGGKGIAAECALSLAKATSTRLVILGRSQPQLDAELATNLARLEAAGTQCLYVSADVCDSGAVVLAVQEALTRFGPITAILHSAGSNTPQSLNTLDEASFLRTLAPKTRGLNNVLAAVDPAPLRWLVTFGSIIARTGFPGEADYAVANEWQTCITEQFGSNHPNCRCVALEWSVWSGVGMGQRLGRVEALIQQGITPITPDEGVRILSHLLGHQLPTAVVVAGRFGEPPTLSLAKPDLPLWRFLERPRVYYPGVELVVDAQISTDTDPYLNDHIFQKQRLFPAVLGLEAMAQAAMVLAASSLPPVFEEVKFLRSLGVADKAPITIRLAALRRDAERVDVVVRSEETGYQVDHYRATCRFGPSEVPPVKHMDLALCACEPLPINPSSDLYGGLLFHSGRFCRLLGYRRLNSRECVAEISPGDHLAWFGPYLPSDLVLGDPAARDAAVHAIQACIPHDRILPIGIDRLAIQATASSSPKLVWAMERQRQGDNFLYDVTVTDLHGRVLEEWDGLRLRAVGKLPLPASWAEPLLVPYIERRLQELLTAPPVAVALERNGNLQRSERSDLAIRRALGANLPVWRRPDGKPEARANGSVSAAHSGDITLAVSGQGSLGCDLETVAARPLSVWQDLLGAERVSLALRTVSESAGDFDLAATRIWVASECLKKAGVSSGIPLTLDFQQVEGWVFFQAGTLAVATLVVVLRGESKRFVAGIALEKIDATENHFGLRALAGYEASL